MGQLSPFRVRLWDIASSTRDRANQVAVIDDAADIGVSAYANEGGEMFFTLPTNHPQIAQIQPWLRHYEVSRLDVSTGDYSAIGVGLIDDYDASEDEVIVYGRDYLSLFELSISAANTSYTNATYSSIITDQLSQAIFAPSVTTKSVTRHIALGTISSTSETTTVLTSYQSRLEFLRELLLIMSSDDSTRPIIKVSRTSPFTVTFEGNAGADRNDVRLEYGGSVQGFGFNPGFGEFATYANGIGQKREGAALLFSTQVYADPNTYGVIGRAQVFLDVVDQAALDRRVKRYARRIGTANKNLSLRLGSGKVAPVTGWDIADSVPVVIDRGLVDINALYTIWGWEWIGKKNGSEDLFLDLLPKQT